MPQPYLYPFFSLFPSRNIIMSYISLKHIFYTFKYESSKKKMESKICRYRPINIIFDSVSKQTEKKTMIRNRYNYLTPSKTSKGKKDALKSNGTTTKHYKHFRPRHQMERRTHLKATAPQTKHYMQKAKRSVSFPKIGRAIQHEISPGHTCKGIR